MRRLYSTGSHTGQRKRTRAELPASKVRIVQDGGDPLQDVHVRAAFVVGLEDPIQRPRFFRVHRRRQLVHREVLHRQALDGFEVADVFEVLPVPGALHVDNQVVLATVFSFWRSVPAKDDLGGR